MSDIIAFDIDGALTKEEGMNEYITAKDTADVVGIVSARSKSGIDEFIEEKGISPDFVVSSITKGMKLRQIGRSYPDGERLYIGSWIRDAVHAAVAGWEYEQL